MLLVSSGLGDLIRIDLATGEKGSLGNQNCGYPTGAIVARAHGVDLTRVGSQRTGATNALRALGRRAAAGILLGDALKRSFSGWDCYILSADPRLAKLIRLSPSRRIPLFNGALECRLLEYRMVAGGMRKNPAA